MEVIHESRYKFRNLSTGFEISGEDRSPVQVHLDGPKITVLDLNNHIETNFGLCSARKILGQCAAILMKNWEPPKDKCGTLEKVRDNVKHMVQDKIKKWAVIKTSKALGKRFAAARKELLKSADATALAVQRAIFAATQKEDDKALKSDFYCEANSYVISDIIKFRAAAASFQYFLPEYNAWDFDGYFCFPNTSFKKSWLDLYSFNGKRYRSLNKTLMKLPGGIPLGMLQRLNQLKLERPLTTRLELIAALETQQHARAHLDVIFRSSRDDIKRALWRYAEHNRVKPKFRKTQDIIIALNYILDYPERHHGNLRGLCEKSIQFHRDIVLNRISNFGYKNETKTTLPPITFPANPNIKFLATVGELANESSRMGHCVYQSYSKKAVMGQSFLFHVEYNEEHATVEVDPKGHVVQAKAEWNKQNKATKYGVTELTKWGRKFPVNKNKVLTLPSGEVEDEPNEPEWALPF